MKNLTNEELLLQYKNGVEEAGNELYIRNKGLIGDLIKKYKNTVIISEDDIFSACNLGFYQAIKSYKVEGDCKFSSYCYHVMMNEVNKSIKHAGRKMRNDLDHSFTYLDDTALNGEANQIIEVMDLSSHDPLVRKDYTYLYDAIEYAKSLIMDKYHPYLVPMLYKEITTYKVADLVGNSRKTVQYTITRFRRLVSEYIENYFSEIEKVSI